MGIINFFLKKAFISIFIRVCCDYKLITNKKPEPPSDWGIPEWNKKNWFLIFWPKDLLIRIAIKTIIPVLNHSPFKFFKAAKIVSNGVSFKKWVHSTYIDISSYSGTASIAFKYVGNGNGNFNGTYELDNVLINAK